MIKDNAVRYLIYLYKADDSLVRFLYRVIDVIIPGVMAQGICDVETAKCLLTVYPDAVTNFKIVKGKIVTGWSEESLKALEDLGRNLPSAFTIVGSDTQAAGRIPDVDDSCDDLDDETYDESCDESYDERFENWEYPEDTPGIGEQGFHWGM